MASVAGCEFLLIWWKITSGSAHNMLPIFRAEKVSNADAERLAHFRRGGPMPDGKRAAQLELVVRAFGVASKYLAAAVDQSAAERIDAWVDEFVALPELKTALSG